jgi:hypothetical protein
MRVKTQQDQKAEAAARTVKDLDSNRRSAAGAVQTWNRRLAPLSIFISRKTQRLYVRQELESAAFARRTPRADIACSAAGHRSTLSFPAK